MFGGGVQHGKSLRREFNVEDGSGFRNFVRMTKSDFEVLFQKFDTGIQRKGTNYHEAVRASIRLALPLRNLANGVVQYIARKSHQLLYYGFCNLHNAHPTNMPWTANPQ